VNTFAGGTDQLNVEKILSINLPSLPLKS